MYHDHNPRDKQAAAALHMPPGEMEMEMGAELSLLVGTVFD